MAISHDCPGLKVEVVVHRLPLQEYDDEDDQNAASHVTTKYIEAQSDKDFALRFAFAYPFPLQYDVEVRIYIDGAKAHVLKCQPHKLYQAEGVTGVVSTLLFYTYI